MYETRLFVTVRCDTCARQYEGYEYDWWPDRESACEEAENDDWQVWEDSHGPHHGCPDHWQMTCAGCGCHKGPCPMDEFTSEGWDYSDFPYFVLCPACDRQPQPNDNSKQ